LVFEVAKVVILWVVSKIIETLRLLWSNFTQLFLRSLRLSVEAPKRSK